MMLFSIDTEDRDHDHDADEHPRTLNIFTHLQQSISRPTSFAQIPLFRLKGISDHFYNFIRAIATKHISKAFV